MNPQEKVLEYARKHNTSNTYTDEQLAGKMIAENVVIARTPTEITFAHITRTGNQIIITETTRTTTHKVENGKVIDIVTESAVEVERINL